ncbi:MAG: serine/threonine protein kinase [Gemmatimonadaceae bacterium]|nr:serine/threonine protein kinase [Gemmatimonadaceae bacterium]
MTTSDFTQIRRQLADRYDLERELGRGGMGAVFLARDRTLDRPVALKILPEEFAADPALRERFLRETRMTASFSHPNIIPVHAVEERPGVVAYAMGFVEGESLAQRVQRAGPLTVRELVRLLQDVGYALAYAHGRGVAHRDIKPDNIMIERATGRALLMDFGIARAITEPIGGGGLTRVGEVVGTPEYMSPEQASGDVVDGRSDLYSLGLVAWFAAIGRPAVTGESVQKILVKQLTETPPPVEVLRPELSDLLSAAIDRCIAKQPEERYQSAEALVEAVDASQLAGPDIPLPIRSFVAELETLSTVLFILVAVSWLVSRSIARMGSSFDAIIPVVILMSVGLTRFLQVLSEARHLGETGFSRDEVFAGMQGVYDERESVRQARRADPATQVRRRRTVRIALVQLAVALALATTHMFVRREVTPRQYVIPTWSIFLLFSGLALMGVSFALLGRSPYRASPPERLFRRLWLGKPGRFFLSWAMRGAGEAGGRSLTPLGPMSRVTGASAAPTARSLSSTVAAPPAGDGTSANDVIPAARAAGHPRATGSLEQLEARVSRLEEWRRQQQR